MAAPRVAVATSGGRDSTALLHATVHAARALGVQVWALHVHHGLMPQADAWLAQVRTQARRWGAQFDCRRLAGGPRAGESIEAWARQQRYRALGEMARDANCTLVLLAHHRGDQAETWLLQALRGGGIAGLAAMPRTARRDGITWARPWLERPRSDIEAYVRRHRLRHADDASNLDPRFARNRLRLQVWPALARAFEGAEGSLLIAASQAQEALDLAAELAQADLLLCANDGPLHIQAWLQLSPARRSNLLRAWLALMLGTSAPRSLVLRLTQELPLAPTGTWPAPGAALGLHRGLLRVVPPQHGDDSLPPPRLDLRRPGRVDLPSWGGQFVVERARDGGVLSAALADVRLQTRQGGERFRFAPAATARSLKKQFQARAVPAWAREGPLLSTPDGRLLFVPGLGIDAAFQAPAGVDQRRLRWEPGLPGETGDGQVAE